ncbi:MAG: ectoine/hydroxyectoine ABC transporter substrate-binding protein EhuB [Pseudomonadota bacterium]
MTEPAGRENRGVAWVAQSFVVAAAAVLLLAGCSDPSPSGDGSTLERARREGSIRIGFADEAPFAYLDTQRGRVTGEAPEVARVILRRLGIEKVQGVLTEFGSLIPGLQAGRFDLIAAGMYVLPERCERIAFSNPTYAARQAFIVKQGNPLGLHGYEDVARHPEAKLGVVAGAVERGYARALGIPDERVVVFPSAANALAGVEAGRVDAYAATALTVRDLLSKTQVGNTWVERADPFRQPVIDGKPAIGYGGFGFRKNDRDLVEAFNRELETFIGTQEHLQLVARFGFTPADLPGEVTAAELCRG